MAKPSPLTALLVMARNTQQIAAAIFKWQYESEQQIAKALELAAAAHDDHARRLAALERQQALLVIGLAELVCAVEDRLRVSDDTNTQLISEFRRMRDEIRDMRDDLRPPVPATNGHHSRALGD